jgi:hypothetical protein
MRRSNRVSYWHFGDHLPVPALAALSNAAGAKYGVGTSEWRALFSETSQLHEVLMTRIRIFGLTITVRSFALSVVLMITIGVAFVRVYGEGVIGVANRVADALLPKSPTIPSTSESKLPAAAPVDRQKSQGGGSEAASIVAANAPTYRADAAKLRGRVLPLHVMPDPTAATKMRILPATTGIRPTGRIAYYQEPVWLIPSRPVLWREVEVAGVTGWVCSYFLQLEEAVDARIEAHRSDGRAGGGRQPPSPDGELPARSRSAS